MRRALAVLFLLIVGWSAAAAQDTRSAIKGIYLMTDYPAVAVRPGTVSNLNITLQNYGLEPERLNLSVSGVPAGWTATLLGGGQPVSAAMPATDKSVPLELRLDVPKDAPMGTQTLTLSAEGGNTHISLPIAVTLAKELPAKLSLQAQLPDLRGSARSTFGFQLSLKNDSGKRLLVSLSAQAPRDFDVSFTELYGSQELSAIPVDAGQSKDIKLNVRPPTNVGAGRYPVTVRVAAEDTSATTEVALEISGQPKLEISGREGLVSASASAGVERSIPIMVTNSGSAPADNVELSGTAPSGWKVRFEPKTIAHVAPGANAEAQALITPTQKAIAGDYVTELRASARGESASSNFRITVTTSTMWGIAGVGIIAIALLVMVGAVARFGRR
ncbi:MAG TPA: NEW3 domain-containing protein [Xanthobacteraceae bacterium]|nr:NEW3 domain-containing protein [Xanthobacteraceae bacterium]